MRPPLLSPLSSSPPLARDRPAAQLRRLAWLAALVLTALIVSLVDRERYHGAEEPSWR